MTSQRIAKRNISRVFKEKLPPTMVEW